MVLQGPRPETPCTLTRHVHAHVTLLCVCAGRAGSRLIEAEASPTEAHHRRMCGVVSASNRRPPRHLAPVCVPSTTTELLAATNHCDPWRFRTIDGASAWTEKVVDAVAVATVVPLLTKLTVTDAV